MKRQRDLFLSASGLALHLGFLVFGHLANSWDKQLKLAASSAKEK
jgi:hypothetical protein